MALLTPTDFINQMVQQLRALDPNISAAEGTPEYKIIATVAEALAQSQIDLNVNNGSLDLNSKYGSNLDAFLQMFGFGRQAAVPATGLVQFSRAINTTNDLFIAQGKQIASSDDIRVVYETTGAVTIPAGQNSVLAPVRALISGQIGNKPANTITEFVDSPIFGVSSVTNPSPINGGVDRELDDEYKARFRNTVFRNLAGTEDQYLATAVASYSTKAKVIGPVSKHIENIQVPSVDDSSINSNGISGRGNPREYTTALSTVTYSKYTYPDSFYISNNDRTKFYSPDADFVVNANVPVELKNRGDTYRMYQEGSLPDITQYPEIYYAQPNITFVNVTDDSDSDTISPNDVVVMQHDYISYASRNDWSRGITNCVDVFVNNENPVAADSVIARPGNHVFNDMSGNILDIENFRRAGRSEIRPHVGNFYSPLLWQPVTSLPESITVGSTTYYLDVHYWLVEDVNLGGSIRARNGIEWASNINGESASDADTGLYSGPSINNNPEAHIEITNYFFDQNIVNVQNKLDEVRPITSDVLAQKASVRYFKFFLTIMYDNGANVDDTNNLISSTLAKSLENSYFGASIQLSDILQDVHNVAGVDNVKWTNDSNSNTYKILECDADGRPLLDVHVDTQGRKAYVSLTGYPDAGTFRLAFGSFQTEPITADATSVQVQQSIQYAYPSASVTGTGAPYDPFIISLPNDHIEVSAVDINLTGGPYAINEDFTLRDDQLPSLPKSLYGTDSAKGLVVIKRVQNTWNKG